MLDTHQHYRTGSDCGTCGRLRCPEFRLATRYRPAPTPALAWWARLAARLHTPRG